MGLVFHNTKLASETTCNLHLNSTSIFNMQCNCVGFPAFAKLCSNLNRRPPMVCLGTSFPWPSFAQASEGLRWWAGGGGKGGGRGGGGGAI